MHVEAEARQEVDGTEWADPPSDKKQLSAPCSDASRTGAFVRLPVQKQRHAEEEAQKRYQQRAESIVVTVVTPVVFVRRVKRGR